jgi:hypothetical protein
MRAIKKELSREPLTVGALLGLYGRHGVILVSVALDELIERDEDFIRRNA